MAIVDRLSDRVIRNLEVPSKGNQIHYDRHPDSPRGFGVRVTSKGSKSFVLRYVARHREYRYTIGPFPDIQTELARREAQKLKAQIALSNGVEHPMATRKSALEEHRARAAAETFSEAVEDYVRREQIGRKANVTADQVRLRLLTDCCDWLERPIGEIAANEIYTFLEVVRDGDPKSLPPSRPRGYTANRLHAYLGTFFRWCASPGVRKIETSPMLGMSKPWCGEAPRTRFFKDKELVAIWNAANEIGGVAGAYVKVAMLTGKRRSALAGMMWREIDQDGLWMPSEQRAKRKNKRLHGVPLPRLALEVLEQIRPARRDIMYVFPGRANGTRLHPGSKLRNKVRQLSGVHDFILHALRHTVETRAAELGVLPHIRDLLLDHAPARGSGAGYDHYHYTKEMRAALTIWSDHIEEITRGKGLALEDLNTER